MKATRPGRMIETFTDQYPYVGPIFWMVSFQYFLTQIVTARAWQIPYSWLHNTISDLGNTACGLFRGKYVCSPLHAHMNASFITLGITMILGAILIYQEFKETKFSEYGFGFMAIAGFGAILVGLFPENTVSILHGFGALLTFLIGNLGLVLLGSALDLPRSLKLYSIISGLVALVALALFISGHYFGFGQGGMERLASYPQTLWLIIFGIYMSQKHYRLRTR